MSSNYPPPTPVTPDTANKSAPEFIFLPEIAKHQGLPADYYVSDDYLNSSDFIEHNKQCTELLENAFAALLNIQSPTLIGAGVLLHQLGTPMADGKKAKQIIQKMGVQTMAVSAHDFYAHPYFVLFNVEFYGAAGTRVLNTVLLHEAKHYVDLDPSCTLGVLNRYRHDIDDGLINVKGVLKICNVGADIQHDTELANLFSADHTLSKFCDGPLARDHARYCIDMLYRSFDSIDQKRKDASMPHVGDWEDDLGSWVEKTQRGRAKLETCLDLFELYRKYELPPDPNGDGHRMGHPEDADVHVIVTGQGEDGDGTGENPDDVDGDGIPKDLDSAIQDADASQKANLEKTAQMAGNTGGFQMINTKFKPLTKPVKWDQALARASTDSAKGTKTTIRHPYQPELHRGIVLPTRRSTKCNALCIFDVSGSMLCSDPPLGEFLTSLRDALHSSVKRLDIVPFDNNVYPTLTYDKSSADKLAEFDTPGGGGTCIEPALEEAVKRGLHTEANLCIIVTDLYLTRLPTTQQLPLDPKEVVWLVNPSCHDEYRKQIQANPSKYGKLYIVE